MTFVEYVYPVPSASLMTQLHIQREGFCVALPTTKGVQEPRIVG